MSRPGGGVGGGGDAASAPVVLVTGSASGIGHAAAERFARAGFRVYASMRRPERGAALRDEAARSGWRLATPAIDVTDDASVTAGVSAVLAETGGRIDVLVNNAGVLHRGAIEETSPDELRAQLETNVIGVLRMVRAVLPAMRARGAGAIVNVGSVSGRMVLPMIGPYHVSKWGIEALTEALRYEVRRFGVRVTCVEPGAYATNLHVAEVVARESEREDSPYRPQMDAYHRSRRLLPPARRLDPVAETIFRAATHPRPKLRWPVGPGWFSGTVLRRFTPDALYEWLVRLVFRARGR